MSVRIRLYYAHKDSEIGLTYWRFFTNVTYYGAILYARLIPEVQTRHQLPNSMCDKVKKKKLALKMRSVFSPLLTLLHSCFLKIFCKYYLFCFLASHRAGFLSVTWAPLHHTTCYLALEYSVDWSASCWILTRFRTKSIIPLNKALLSTDLALPTAQDSAQDTSAQ